MKKYKMKKYKKVLFILLLLIVYAPLLVYALQVKNITINKDGGSGGTDKAVATGNEADKLLLQEAVVVPTKKNKTFLGYYNNDVQYYDSNGNRTYNDYIPSSLKKIKAKWGSGETGTIYFVKNSSACTKAKNSNSCQIADGCYDTITDQVKGKVMKKSHVIVPDLGESVTFFGYTEKPNDSKTAFYDIDGNLIGNRKWTQGSSKSCLYANTKRETVSGSSNGADTFTKTGYGILVELIKYEGNEEKSIGIPYLYANADLLASIEEEGPSDGSTALFTAPSGGTTACIEGVSPGGCDNVPPGVITITHNETYYLSNTLLDVDSWGKMDKNGYFSLHSTILTRLANGELSASPIRCQQFVQNYNFSSTYHYTKGDIRYKVDPSSPEIKIPDGHIITVNNIQNKNMYKYSKSLATDYFGNIEAIASAFGKDEKQKREIKNDLTHNLDKYYLSFEPVVREKTGTALSEDYQSSYSQTVFDNESWYYTCPADCYSKTIPSKTKPTDECKMKDSCKKYNDCKSKTPCEERDSNGHCTKGEDCVPGYDSDGQHCKCPHETSAKGAKVDWDRGGCAGYKITTTNFSYHTDTFFKTIIKPARYHGNSQIIKSLSTTVDQNETKHKNEETKKMEYYMGPDLETALAGQCGKYPDKLPSRYVTKCDARTNKYSLYNASDFKNLKFTVNQAKTVSIGVLYLWGPELTSCANECPPKDYPDKTSNSLLKCAENYCDSLYYYEDGKGFESQKLKADCITTSCKYEKTQNNCDMQLNNSSFIESILTGAGSNYNTQTKYESKCNIGENNQISDKNYGYKASCLLSSKTGNNEFDVVLDRLQFVNVMCVEGTSCGFMDVSREKLTKGRRIDYYQKVHLIKKCKVWFDEKSWKFYYASIPSNETLQYSPTEITTSRNRMIQLLLDYNDAAKRGYSGSISSSIAEDSSVTWEQLKYDLTGLDLRLDVEEQLQSNGRLETKKTTILNLTPVTSEDVNSEGEKEVTDKEKLNISDITTESTKKTAYSYERLNKIPPTQKFDYLKEIVPKVYSTSSSYDATYEIPDMYCLALDKEATPYKYDGKTCPDGTMPVHAYYLSLQVKKANFKSTCAKEDYLLSTDTCEPTPDVSFFCDIHVTGDKYCCEDYNGPVDIQLLVHSNPTTSVKVRGIGLYTIKPNEAERTDDVNGHEAIKNFNPHGTVKIVGTVLYGTEDPRNQTKVHCYKEIKVDECSKDKCSIEKDETNFKSNEKTKYNVTAKSPFTSGGTKYYAKTNSRSSKYQLLGMEDNKYAFYVTQKEVLNARNDPENKALNVIGKVQNGNSCGICCNNVKYKTEFEEGCTINLEKLKKYCASSYRTDIHCFDTYEDCITEYYGWCTCPPYSISSNLDSLKTWCKAKYRGLWLTANECIQICCQDGVKCANPDIPGDEPNTEEVVYRPIDNTCPFPNSIEATGDCEQGERLIGRNWIGYIDLITEEGDRVYDKSNEEYVIDLNKSKIKTIKTKYAYDKSGTSRYYVYDDARGKDKQCDIGTYTGYCSTFIRESNYFSKIRGVYYDISNVQ